MPTIHGTSFCHLSFVSLSRYCIYLERTQVMEPIVYSVTRQVAGQRWAQNLTPWLPDPATELHTTSGYMQVAHRNWQYSSVCSQVATGIDIVKPVISSEHYCVTLSVIYWQKCCAKWLPLSHLGQLKACLGSKTEDVIVCCLVRAIRHFRGWW